jgi:DNA-binding NarL/FixJ family response regulator
MPTTRTKTQSKPRPWTPAALKTLKQMVNKGSSAKSIANRLHRTEGAIRQQCGKQGFHINSRGK